MADHDPDFRVDILVDKHECGSYLGDPIRIAVEYRGESLEVWIPEPWPDPDRLKVEVVVIEGDLMFFLARHRAEKERWERGFVCVANRRRDGTYVAKVWHELFEFTLGKLGLYADETNRGSSL